MHGNIMPSWRYFRDEKACNIKLRLEVVESGIFFSISNVIDACIILLFYVMM